MKDRILRAAATQKMEAGKTKQQAYTELATEFPGLSASRLAEIVRMTPSLLARERHHQHLRWFIAMCYTLAVVRLMVILNAFNTGDRPMEKILPLALVIGLGYCAYELGRHQLYVLKFCIFIAFFHLMRTMTGPLEWPLNVLGIFGILLALALLLTGWYLLKNMVPDFTWQREVYLNAEGRERSRKKPVYPQEAFA